MIPQLPRLSDYDISPQHGFLPAEIPLDLLPDPYYGPWETIIRNLQGLVLSKRLRGVVDHLPVLSTDFLVTEAEWRRAYVVLAFMAHAYIWGGDSPADVCAPQLLCELAKLIVFVAGSSPNIDPIPRCLPSSRASSRSNLRRPCFMELEATVSS